jgi:hypothetical protein
MCVSYARLVFATCRISIPIPAARCATQGFFRKTNISPLQFRVFLATTGPSPAANVPTGERTSSLSRFFTARLADVPPQGDVPGALSSFNRFNT